MTEQMTSDDTTDDRDDRQTTTTYDGDHAWESAQAFIDSRSLAPRVTHVELTFDPRTADGGDTTVEPPQAEALPAADEPDEPDDEEDETDAEEDETDAEEDETDAATGVRDTEDERERRVQRAKEALLDAVVAHDFVPGDNLSRNADRDVYPAPEVTRDVKLPASSHHDVLTLASHWPGLTSKEYEDKTDIPEGTVSGAFTRLDAAGFTYTDRSDSPSTHYLTEAGERALDLYGITSVPTGRPPRPAKGSNGHAGLTVFAKNPGATSEVLLETGVVTTGDSSASALMADLRARHLVKYEGSPPYNVTLTQAGRRVLNEMGPHPEYARSYDAPGRQTGLGSLAADTRGGE